MLINKTVLFTSEAACVLGCSVHRIYGLVHSGIMKAYKDEGSRYWKIPEQSIMDYIRLRLNQKNQ